MRIIVHTRTTDGLRMKSLSVGAIAGVTCSGVVVIVALLVITTVVIFMLYKKMAKNKNGKDSESKRENGKM